MFKNSLNISRMVFASKAMSRRILSIVSNRKNSRLMLSHLRESEKKVKEVVPTYTKQNTFQVKAIDMTINKNEDISLPITRWSSIAFDLDLRMLRNILLNDKLWKGKDLSNKIKPFELESLK